MPARQVRSPTANGVPSAPRNFCSDVNTCPSPTLMHWYSGWELPMIVVEKRFTGENRYTVYIGDIVVGRGLSSSSADALVAELRSRAESV